MTPNSVFSGHFYYYNIYFHDLSILFFKKLLIFNFLNINSFIKSFIFEYRIH